ncbi:MAG TPA: 4-(cytidine 5'-diphospho)-2-C-methyl-D-erythritol kinase [Bacteroidales bacterium]|nr:4-(cytidine 5'-diphospho)-2-C-methyl-D-erythritol kinase [Bacteroidales bacterium]
MIVFPNAKINIGLNIVSRREDGFHNIETVFYPVKSLCDILEIIPMPEQHNAVTFNQTGLIINEPDENNLCVKAYHLLRSQTELPPVTIHLHKQIPFGAGLGGGSSDGAHTLISLNALSPKPLPKDKLLELALQLGSDCPFFIYNSPCFATGRGELLLPIQLDLSGLYILLVNPGLHVNTGKAYSLSNPKTSEKSLDLLIRYNRNEWRNLIFNDFEEVVFEIHHEIAAIKDNLYKMGAVYASMSGSGSTVFGIFTEKINYELFFSNYFTFYQRI